MLLVLVEGFSLNCRNLDFRLTIPIVLDDSNDYN
jgi:hypothetical protein